MVQAAYFFILSAIPRYTWYISSNLRSVCPKSSMSVKDISVMRGKVRTDVQTKAQIPSDGASSDRRLAVPSLSEILSASMTGMARVTMQCTACIMVTPGSSVYDTISSTESSVKHKPLATSETSTFVSC